jgi:uncharacterized protein (UPF0276 family)
MHIDGQVVRPIPARAGIGLRADHYQAVHETRPPVGWLEVHSENYFAAGGAALQHLERLRHHYPLSFHGVGLSLGSTDPLNLLHLEQLRRLIDRFQPALVSEHLSWGSVGGIHMNDLLPMPYTQRTVDYLETRIGQVQDHLGRRILVENISSYLRFADDELGEAECLAQLARRTGCGILFDVNNVYVSARNHNVEPMALLNEYLDAMPREAVREIHLAGHTVKSFDDGILLIDTHDQLVCDAVWMMYEHTLQRLGPVPTLIEWDTSLPPLEVLVGEARRADRYMENSREAVA